MNADALGYTISRCTRRWSRVRSHDPRKWVTEIALHASEKAFRRGVIPTVSLAAHALDDSITLEKLEENDACILASAIGMKNRSGNRPARCDGGSHSRNNEVCIDVRTHRPANDATRSEIEHDGKVEPSLTGLNVGDIAGPHAVLIADSNNVKLSSQDVLRNRQSVIRIRRSAKGPSPNAIDSRIFHDPPNALRTDSCSLRTEFSMNSRIAIRPPTVRVNTYDFVPEGSRRSLRANSAADRATRNSPLETRSKFGTADERHDAFFAPR